MPQVVICIPWGGTRTPVLPLNYCFLAAFPLFPHSLTFLIINCLSLFFGTQERPRRLKSFFPPTNNMGNFFAGPVVKTLNFQCRGSRFGPWSGN